MLPPAGPAAELLRSENGLAAIGRAVRSVGEFLRSSRYGAIGLGILAVYAVIALFGSFLTPYSPTQIFGGHALAPPGPIFKFGTDQNGMDILSRTIAAARVDMGVATASEAISVVLGVGLGLLTGFRRGWIDLVILRAMDVLQAFPVLVLAIAIVAATQQSISTAIFVIAFVDIPVYTRLIRGEVLLIRESTYIMAAIAVGNPLPRLLARHVLPNAVPPVVTQVAIRYAYAIKLIAALAFVGVGIHVPTPEWGSMIRTGTPSIISGLWWPTVFPGVAVGVLILGLNLLADGLQQYWDPKSHRD